MPLETATFINNLVASNPASTDTVSQADDHIRLIKQVLKTTFPNLNAPVTATPAQLNSSVPAGFIGMWSGSLATIPATWALCDGSGGRPDLRDRFIVGAGNTYAVAATGGANSVTLVVDNVPPHNHTTSVSGSVASADISHSHTFSATTASAGSHSHTVRLRENAGSVSSPVYAAGGQSTETTSQTTEAAGAHTHTVSGTTAAGGGSHSHSVTLSASVGNTGGGVAHENRPPYYALAFIIKL